MSRTRAVVVAVVVVAVLAGSWVLLARPGGTAAGGAGAGAPAGAAAEPTDAPTTTPPPPPSTPADPAPTGPPAGTTAVATHLLDRYGATRVGWDDVLDRGRPLPRPDRRCARAWRRSGKDPRLDWGPYWCLDALRGRGYKPQGVAGSGTTQGYRIGGRPAAERNLVLTSWYSRRSEPGLFAGHVRGRSVTRLVVVDLDRRRYGTVELVRVDGGRLRSLDSHGSGLAWAGQYLYSSSRSSLWMFNADDLLEIDGHLVLPAVAHWSASGRGGLSSISVERSATHDRLVAVNFTRTGRTWLTGFDLDRTGRPATRSRPAGAHLALTPRTGPTRDVARSVTAVPVPGRHFQGAARWRRYGFANSSALALDGAGPPADALVVLHDGEVLDRFALPGGNVESVYVDYRRRTYTSLTEAGMQFLFVLPLDDLVERAGR